MRWTSTGALIAASLALGVSPAGARTSAPPRVHLNQAIPTLLAAGERVKLSGRVTRAPHAAKIALEERSGSGWRIVKRAALAHGAFVLSWAPPAGRSSSLRITLRAAHRVLAVSSPVSVRVGPAPVYCPKPQAPASLPPGAGWVEGGLYLSGGPAPGSFACKSGPYPISAIDEAGETSATLQVSGQDYVLVLPAGSYELESEHSCFSEEAVTVTAGKGVKADTICNVP